MEAIGGFTGEHMVRATLRGHYSLKVDNRVVLIAPVDTPREFIEEMVATLMIELAREPRELRF